MWRRRSILVHAFAGRRAEPPPAIEGSLAAAVARGVVEWRQGGRWWAPHWGAWSEGRCVATYRPAGRFGRRAEFATDRDRLTVGPSGWLGGATLRREGHDAEVLRFRPAWLRGGRIERAAGPALRWAPGFFGSAAAVRDEEGFELLELSLRRSPFRSEGEARITDAGRRLPDIVPFVALTWWLLLDLPRRRAMS